MKTMLVLRLVRENDAHSQLCLSGQRPAKIIIDAANSSDWIATDLTISQVANATGLQSIAFWQEFIQRFRPVLNGLAVDVERIDSITKHATKEHDQAGYPRC